jgi:hypothetical protein
MAGHIPSQDARASRRRKNANATYEVSLRRSARKLSFFSVLVRQTWPHKVDSGVARRAKPQGSTDNEPIYILERVVKHRLGEMVKSPSTSGTSRKTPSWNLTQLQTLSTYRDALKADEFALRYDSMTFGIICVQVMRIVQVALRDIPVSDISFLDEHTTAMAVQILLDCSNLRSRFYGILGKRPKVWSIIYQIIDRIGDLAYEISRTFVPKPTWAS